MQLEQMVAGLLRESRVLLISICWCLMAVCAETKPRGRKVYYLKVDASCSVSGCLAGPLI